MSTFWKSRRPGRSGHTASGPSTTAGVDGLLDAARASGTPRELAREDEALMLFQRAHLARTTASGDDRAAPRSSRRSLQALVATGGVVAVMSSGIAFAASGHAPWSHSPAPAPASSAGPQSTVSPEGTVSSGDSPTSPDSTAPTSGTTTVPAARAHAFRGLCRAYASGHKAEHGHALAGPAFAGLVAAAGGPDAVSGFCATVLPATDDSSASAEATQTTHPVHPTQPAHPSHPAHPSSGATPTHPAHPTKPAHPAKPAQPTKPAHPTPGAAPTHPTHPAHPTHS